VTTGPLITEKAVEKVEEHIAGRSGRRRQSSTGGKRILWAAVL
jgi:acyl-CoA reductase-like NAD-dependent aldehyde dehydrogenase